ncbi:hypothetical protein [Tumebacillus lipolyticus]|uniref:Lipoprotein n=1 Tax=Tumebacillus lipolyticus TaxID=1280370 RepID=A0ABW4ZU65_9BACL
MKKRSALIIVTTLLFLASGCSFDSEREALTQKANELKQKAQDTLQQLKEDAALQKKLMESANVGQEKVHQFLTSVMEEPIVQQAIDQLGYDAVINIISEQVSENGGSLSEASLNKIKEELAKRVQAQ